MTLTRLDIRTSSQVASLVSVDDGSSSSIEGDLFQITNIAGLDPVKASLTTISPGDAPGATIIGTDIPARNILLTIRTNPDWDGHSHESLRAILNTYFTPTNTIDLVFYKDDEEYVEISGVVEGMDDNIFSKDPEVTVSIICEDPYFTRVVPQIIYGTTINPSDTSVDHIVVNGDVAVGFILTLPDGYSDGTIIVQAGDPAISTFRTYVASDVLTFPNIFEMDSRPLRKYIRTVEIGDGVITNILGTVQDGSKWPKLYPGDNIFAILADNYGYNWELRYFDKYGGI